MLIIHWAGYDINGIPAFWESMSQRGGNEFDFFSTHPSDDKRIANMRALIDEINSQKDFTSGPVIGDAQPTKEYGKKPEAPQAPACPKCGAQVDPGDKFCTNCGTQIG